MVMGLRSPDCGGQVQRFLDRVGKAINSNRVQGALLKGGKIMGVHQLPYEGPVL